MIKRKIYIVGGGVGYINWMEAEIAGTIDESDLVCFTGGEDCWPGLYSAKVHPTTYYNMSRDTYEVKMFKKAQELSKPMIGTCRGAQFLCCMAGGKLVQDQENPRFMHPMHTYDGQYIIATSTHHQAQHPWNLPADSFKLLAWTNGISSYHDGENINKDIVIGTTPEDKEVESVYYSNINALANQSHPEMAMTNYERSEEWAVEYINWCRVQLDKLMDRAF